MKKEIFSILLLLISFGSFGQNHFKQMVDKLETIDYCILYYKCDKPIGDSGCETDPANNWVNKFARINNSRKREYIADSIDYLTILKIESHFIQGKKELLPKTYGRAEIQQWTFINNEAAKKALEIVNNNNINFDESFHKAPWTVWQSENKLYFILTAGTYVQGDLPIIEKKLKE